MKTNIPWEELSPLQKLIRSRKFWLMVLDVVISTATYLLTWLTSPELAERIIWLIGAWQPVMVALILGIAHEDAAEKRELPAIYFEPTGCETEE